jgi:antitoxin (DNA-binding transcriptional repressor) of toxin-antitoxin stability system
MAMRMTRMPAGVFKDQCLKVLDRVAATRSPVVVTKRGRPVAAVVPFTAPAKGTETLAGSVLEEHGDPFGTGEDWDAPRS